MSHQPFHHSGNAHQLLDAKPDYASGAAGVGIGLVIRPYVGT